MGLCCTHLPILKYMIIYSSCPSLTFETSFLLHTFSTSRVQILINQAMVVTLALAKRSNPSF